MAAVKIPKNLLRSTPCSISLEQWEKNSRGPKDFGKPLEVAMHSLEFCSGHQRPATLAITTPIRLLTEYSSYRLQIT